MHPKAVSNDDDYDDNDCECHNTFMITYNDDSDGDCYNYIRWVRFVQINNY